MAKRSNRFTNIWKQAAVLMRCIIKVLPLIYWPMANFYVTKRDLNFRTCSGLLENECVCIDCRGIKSCSSVNVTLGYQLALTIVNVELWPGMIIWWRISFTNILRHLSRDPATSVWEWMRNLLFRNGYIVMQSSIIPVMGFACNPMKYECINTWHRHEMRDLLLFSVPVLISDDLQPQTLSLSPPVRSSASC